MNKTFFKSIQQSMIEASFMDFYFPQHIDHPFVNEMKSYQEKASNYRLQILIAKNEEELKIVADKLNKQLKTFDQLSKDDFPGINYFFSTLHKDEFNFEFMKEMREKNYEKLSFLQKMKLKVSVAIPEQYFPSDSVKEAIFNDFGFQYLYVPHRNLTAFQSERSFYNFINQTKKLLTQMNKPSKAISLFGEIGVYLEVKTPLYGHKPKCIGFTPDIVSSSILHEWTHALDNYVFHKLSGINDFASENTESFTVKNKNFLPAYEAIKKALFEVCNLENTIPANAHEVIGQKQSIYFLNCRAADEDLFITPGNYFQKPCEILARMTESGEFNNYTEGRNKEMTNIVYLKDWQNPYQKLKEPLFSLVDKPLHKIQQLRQQNSQIPELGIKIPKKGI